MMTSIKKAKDPTTTPAIRPVGELVDSDVTGATTLVSQ